MTDPRLDALADAVRAYLETLGNPRHAYGRLPGDGCAAHCPACARARLVDALERAIVDDLLIGTYRLDLDLPRPPKTLTANGARRAHPMAAADDTKRIRKLVARLATEAGIPRCGHLTLALTWAPGTRHKRDEDNLWPLLKALADGLATGGRKATQREYAGLQLVPDDDRRYMTKHAPRILTPDETTERGMWLTVEARTANPYAPRPPAEDALAVGLFEATS